jgi:cysteine desulfurase
MGKACELAEAQMKEDVIRMQTLRDRLETEFVSRIPGTRINGDRDHRLPNTLNISFEGIEGESILLLLSKEGIGASSGSACTSGSLEPSHVLRAMGVPFGAIHGSIRFSLSRYNNDEDIDYILEKLPPIIGKLRELSPFWPPKA